jgi:NAD(P)-dependent dehydrogenase (short-subunit alcohol dehydrogenase family)
LTCHQYIYINKDVNRVAIVTGATRNLGLALAGGLAQRLGADDVVYLTGRDEARVHAALAGLSRARAHVRPWALDVSDGDAVRRFAGAIAERHGGVDVLFSNHYARVQPDEDPAQAVERYVAVNNLGTTHVLRAFEPLLRAGSRLLVVASTAGSLRALAPALHARFADLGSLDEVDAAVCAWRDAVRDGRAAGEAWPAWINIPSKIGQVAAVRALARGRRLEDLRRGILIAAVCPGLIDTGASRPWLDVARAQTPTEAAQALLDLALDADPSPDFYGQLVRFGEVLPWRA